MRQSFVPVQIKMFCLVPDFRAFTDYAVIELTHLDFFIFFFHYRCYCILHDDNVLGAIFSIWEELRSAESWEEVELTVWGELNNYKGFL